LTQKTVTLPKEVEKELTLLRGFRDLVAERTGYLFGSKALTKVMNEKTETERKLVTTIRKGITENIPEWIENKNVSEYVKQMKALKEARKKNTEARKPHMEKINPLRKATKYIDVVAIPDALKELGSPVHERFSLSKWVKEAIETKKKD